MAIFFIFAALAQVAKLVDAPSSGGGAARCAGSNPVLGTNTPTFAGIFLAQKQNSSVSNDNLENSAPLKIRARSLFLECWYSSNLFLVMIRQKFFELRYPQSLAAMK